MRTTLFLSIAVSLAFAATASGMCADCCHNKFQSDTDSLQRKSLNQIRFENWTDEDWVDNDYYRCIRETFDSYLAGEIEFSELDEYRELLPGKFFIGFVEPFIYGGLFIQISFIDAPEKIFQTSVYSFVDKEKQELTGKYEMRGFKMLDVESGLTKEIAERLLKEHPEYKLY